MELLARPDTDRRWSVANAVYFTYTLFLAGFYFVPNAVDLYKFYIAAVFFPALLLLPQALGLARKSLTFNCLAAYLLYMLVTSLWSATFSIELFWRDLCYGAYILMFVLLTVLLFTLNSRLLFNTARLVTVIAAASAALAIVLFDATTQLPSLTEDRLAGFGITKNPNPAAFVFGLFGVAALHFTMVSWGRRAALLFAASFLVLALYVLLTQSNTGLLALTGASAVLILTTSGKRSGLIAGAVMAVVAVLYLTWSLGLLSTDIDEGFVKRFPIWVHNAELWLQSPVFGNGFQNTLLITPQGEGSKLNYAHSLFLATLRDGGLTGFFLLLGVVILALRQGIRLALTGNGNGVFLALLVFGLVCILVDVDQAITRPRELWIILWLPLSCLIATELGASSYPKLAPERT